MQLIDASVGLAAGIRHFGEMERIVFLGVFVVDKWKQKEFVTQHELKLEKSYFSEVTHAN